eukprot:scaffold22482_cov69-Phaeocystis_antarctica.AAC.10
MPQSEPAGQEQMASVQQARTLRFCGAMARGAPCRSGSPPSTSLLPANQPRRLWPQQACQTSPRDIPQQPSSLLVAGKELGAESTKDDTQIAPAQATP